MNRLKFIFQIIALGTVPVVGVAVVWFLVTTGHKIPDLKPTAAGFNAVAAKLIAPCAGSGKTSADKANHCGTLSLAGQDLADAGDLVKQEQFMLKKTLPDLFSDVHTSLSGFNRVTASIAGTGDAATMAINTFTAGEGPLLASANKTFLDVDTSVNANSVALAKSVKDFDDLVTSKDVARFLKGSADSSEQLALTGVQVTGIATDLRKDMDRATAPQPWWRKAMNYGNLAVNIACLATHSCPF